MANKIEIRGAEIKRKNFEGKEKRNPKNGKVVNSEGNRNFLLVIPDDMVEELVEEGYNIRQFREDEVTGEPGDYYLPVKVGFAYKPPTIWLITYKKSGKTRTRLDEHDVKCLDSFTKDMTRDVKLVVRPVYGTNDDGSTKITAYLELLYYEIDSSDPFADDYDWDDDAVPFDE